MKIYSWNVLFKNKNSEGICAFITSCTFDVFCLQEVTDELLEQLRALPYHLVYGIDARDARGRQAYLVTLSPHQLSSADSYPLPLSPLSFRVRAFIAFMGRVGFGWARLIETRALGAVMERSGHPLRIDNAHFTLFGPDARKQELEGILQRMGGTPGIIAGDMNIIEHPYLKILNWLLGASFTQGMPWHNERRAFEVFITERKLMNPLLGKRTHPFSESQLDHILVPKGVPVRDADVIKDRYGSDHCPVFVDVAI